MKGLCSKHQLWKSLWWPIKIINAVSTQFFIMFDRYPDTWSFMYDVHHSVCLQPCLKLITLYILTSVYIFFMLFSIMVLTERICLTIKSFFSWWSFPLFSWPHAGVRVNTNRGNSYSSLLWVKGLIRAVSKSTLIISCSR